MKQKPLRVCLIATEYPGMGPYGGFGVLTRDIATGLVARGLDVVVAMPRKPEQSPMTRDGGITVISYPTPVYGGLRKALPYSGLYKTIDADIYHSQEPSTGTALALRAVPHKKHMVTFQDPREIDDWRQEWAPAKRSRARELAFSMRYQWEIGGAARRAHVQCCQAKYIIPRTKRMYGLSQSPRFLPNPLRLPEIKHPKAAEPTVCYLGRWDARKRPELLIELASKFPEVKFIFAGACLNDPDRDRSLRQRAAELKNVEMPGWVNATDRAAILDKAWIMINTSTRECLPVSYLEASAQKCAILSHCNADDFASEFGYWAQTGDLDDYIKGLRHLLEQNRWRELGERGHRYVKDTHEYDKVIDQHVTEYQRVMQL